MGKLKMGMFDYVNISIKCPKCGTIINGFQSKDRECELKTLELELEEVDNFYSSCPKCHTWIEFTRKEKIKRLMSIEDLKRDFDIETRGAII